MDAITEDIIRRGLPRTDPKLEPLRWAAIMAAYREKENLVSLLGIRTIEDVFFRKRTGLDDKILELQSLVQYLQSEQFVNESKQHPDWIGSALRSITTRVSAGRSWKGDPKPIEYKSIWRRLVDWVK